MGMAASQARLLSITSRMADNELRAQIINNSKMRLATESSKVSEEYVAALNSATMMMSNYDTAGNSQYQKLSFNSLTNYSSYNNQYALINTSGQILVSENEAQLYKDANGDLNTYLGLHNLEFSSTYFSAETLGATEISLLGVNPNTNVEYEIGNYPVDLLKEMYEGSETHIGYNNGLQSAEYKDFSDYFNQFELAEDNYNLQLYDTISKEIFDTDWNNAYTKYVTNSTDRSMQDLIDGINYLDKKLGGLVINGKLTTNADNDKPNTFYDDMIAEMQSLKFKTTDGSITATVTATDKVSSGKNKDDKNQINLGQQYQTATGDVVSEIVAIEGDNGKYTLQVNPELQKQLQDEGITIQFSISGAENTWTRELSGLTLEDLKNFKYEVSEQGQDDEGNPANDVTVYTYECDIDNGTGTATWEATQAEVQSTVENLFLMFKSGVINSVNKDAYVPKDTDDSSLVGQAKKAYHDALNNLINFIFGDKISAKEKEELENNASNLNDVGWIMTNYPNQTTDKFEVIKDIYILDSLFNKFGEPAWGWIDTNSPQENAEAKVKWYTNLFNHMQQGFKVLEDGLASSNEWIQFALESGLVSVEQVDKSNNWTATVYSNISDITEVTDDVAVARAEAEYKKAMNNIENKDKRFDMELKNIDTEHNSLQTEYDSVKSVIDKNIERSFKMYS